MNSGLRHAYNAVDAGTIDLLSVDIFKALIWRKTPTPEDLFLILGRKLKNEGWLIPGILPEGFAHLRILAEQTARYKKEKASGSPKVTLKEIYWQLSGIFPRITIEELAAGKQGIFDEADVDALVAFEVDLNDQLLELNREIVSLIAYAHDKKVSVVLVADTFFELPHIQKFLSKSCFGLKKPLLKMIHKIYLSCENDVDLDIKSSRTYRLEGTTTNDLLPLEWPEHRPKKRMEMLDPIQGDFGLTRLRKKIQEECPATLKGKNAFFWNYGASVWGPILAGFVLRVFQRAQDLGETRAFCLMREGQLYANIIRRLTPYLPQYRLEPIEFWATRHLVSHAAITYGSAEELYALTSAHPSSRFTVESFCGYLGLTFDSLPKLKKWRCIELTQGDFCLKVAQILSQHPETKQQILRVAAAKRQRFLNYLSKYFDLSKESRLLIVDTGWSGTIQGALRTLFSTQNLPITVQGLYLNTDHNVNASLLHGDIREGYLLKSGYPEGLVPAVKQGILEPIATSSLGPLLDIDAEGQIVTGKPRTSKREQQETLLVQQGIFAFCDLLGQELRAGSITWNAYSEPLEEQLRRILVRASSLPTKEEADHLRSWTFDLRSDVDTHFLSYGENPYYQKMIGDLVPEALFKDKEVLWPPGYAAQEDSFLAKQVQTLQLGSLPKECFLSQDSLTMHIFINHGSGFGKVPKKRQLRSNPNRSFYALETIPSYKRDIRQLRLVFPEKQELRFKSLCLKTKRRLTPGTTERVFFEESSREKGLQMQSDEKGLSLTFAFDEPDLYEVAISLCCALEE